MKKTLEEISDLSNIKVGDKLFSTMFGDVTVESLEDNTRYPIEVCSLDGKIRGSWSFTKDGRYYYDYDYGLQVLFLSNPFDLITNNNSGEKWMMVSHDKRVWVKRRVIKKVGDKYVVWNQADTDEQVDTEIYTATFPYAKEIMREIQVTIELTDKEIDFLKNLVLNDKNEFEWEIDDYDMWNRLLNYGIANVLDYNYTRYKILTDIGVEIKNKLL